MNMKIKTYLINLDDSTERLTAAMNRLDSAGWSFERFSAFDGRNIDLSQINEYNAQKSLKYMGRKLKGGEIGCYFSHLNCVKQFLTSDFDYAVVLEDDMTITENTLFQIKKILHYFEINHIDWHLVNIGANKCKIATPMMALNGNQKLYHAHYFPMTTTGLVWSKSGAEDFIEEGRKEIFCPVDNYFRYKLTRSNKGYTVYPPLTPPNGMDSDIDNHQLKRKQEFRHPLYGLIKQKRLIVDKLIASKHKYL